MKRTVLNIALIAIVIAMAILPSASTAAGGPNPSFANVFYFAAPLPDEVWDARSPFMIEKLAQAVLIPSGKIYPGEELAYLEVSITNIGRLPYAVAAYATAIPEGEAKIYFDVKVIKDTSTFYYGQLIIEPGETARVTIRVSLAYWSTATVFTGLTVNIVPAPPGSSPELG